jgi:hypothetical protein
MLHNYFRPLPSWTGEIISMTGVVASTPAAGVTPTPGIRPLPGASRRPVLSPGAVTASAVVELKELACKLLEDESINLLSLIILDELTELIVHKTGGAIKVGLSFLMDKKSTTPLWLLVGCDDA